MQKNDNNIVVLNSLVSQLEISLGFNANVNGSVLRHLPLTQFLVKFSSIVSLADKGRIAEYNSAIQRFNFNLSYLDNRFSFNGTSCLDFTSYDDIYVVIKILMSVNDEEQLKGLRGDKLKVIIGFMAKLEKENPNVHKTLSYRVIRLFLSLLVIGRCFCAFIVCSFIRNQFWIGEGLNPYSKSSKKNIKTFKETLFNKKSSHKKRVVDSVKESIANTINLVSSNIAYGAIKVADSVKGYAEGYVERQEGDDVKKDSDRNKKDKPSKKNKPSPNDEPVMDDVEETIEETIEEIIEDTVEDKVEDNVEETTSSSTDNASSYVDSNSMFDENDENDSFDENDEDDSFDENDEDNNQVEDSKSKEEKPKEDSNPNGKVPQKVDSQPKAVPQQAVPNPNGNSQSNGKVSNLNGNSQPNGNNPKPNGNDSSKEVSKGNSSNDNPNDNSQPKGNNTPKEVPNGSRSKDSTYVDSSSIFDNPSNDNSSTDNSQVDNSLFENPSNDNSSNVISPSEVMTNHVLTESTTFNSFSSLTEDSNIKATSIEDDLNDFI